MPSLSKSIFKAEYTGSKLIEGMYYDMVLAHYQIWTCLNEQVSLHRSQRDPWTSVLPALTALHLFH